MILQLTALPEFEASEVTISGERFLLIPYDALAGLYRPKVEAEPVPAPKPKAKSKKGAKEKKIGDPITVRTPRSFESTGTAEQEVRKLLEGSPQTSGELVEALKGRVSSSSIYAALSSMRKRGDVKTNDDENGFRRNYLAKAA